MQKLLAIIGLLLLVIPSGYAISSYTKDIFLDFEPYLEYNTSFYIFGAERFDVFIEGGLKEYGVLDDPNPRGGDRRVYVSFKLPAELPTPGKWALFVTAKEIPPPGAGVGGIAAIRNPLYVFVPYPGYYATMGIRIENVEINDTGVAVVVINNKGQNDITQGELKFWINDEEEQEVYSRTVPLAETVAAGTVKDQNIEFSTKEFSPGSHKGFAVLDYHGKNSTADRDFRVGDKEIGIVDYPKKLPYGAIEEFKITLLANWKYKLPVYAEIFFGTAKVGTTATEEMGWFSQKVFSAYVNTRGLETGEHVLKIIVYFGDLEKTVEDKIILFVAEEVEEPKGELNTTLLLISAIGAIVIIVAIVLLAIILVKKK